MTTTKERHEAMYRSLRWVLVVVSMGLSLVASGQSMRTRATSGGGRKESPYETIMRLRREAADEKTPEREGVSLGPVVATATLKLVPPTLGSPVNFLGLQRYDTTGVRPAALKEVPADAPRDPAYFAVRVGDREILGLTYRSVRPPGPVKFSLDTDGDGLLSDESQYVGAWLHWLYPRNTFQFGPVYLRQGATGPGGDTFYVQCSGGEWLTLHTAFYREGQVVLNGKRHKMALVDKDFDGRFNQSFVPPAADSRDPQCDVLAMDLNGDSKFNYGKQGESEIMPLSTLIKVGGDYYRLDVSENGRTVEFRQARPALGRLDLGGEEVVLGLWSDAAQQRLSSFRGKLSLPAGRYAIVSLELTKSDSGDRWTFDMSKETGQLGDFEIRPGETTAFKIGPPFQVRASMRRFGNAPDVSISFDLEGQAGERYSAVAKKNDKEVPEPSFKIWDRAGRVVQSGQFAYS